MQRGHTCPLCALSHHFTVFSVHIKRVMQSEIWVGVLQTICNPGWNLESHCQVLAKGLLYTRTQRWRYCTAQQPTLWACRHRQLPVVLFPQVPSVTQPLPDRSNHRQDLFRSHPRLKAQHVPKEMTETYKSIALFFSFFDPILNASMRFDNTTRRGGGFHMSRDSSKGKRLRKDRSAQPHANLRDYQDCSWE